jgi:DNA-3-methyladenine glycosylase I
MAPKKQAPCLWAPLDDPVYRQYHDEEWGVPEYDDRALYEKLILDGFQAGLSWRTILYKRENFRKAFDGFNPEKIARYTPKKIERLMNNEGIIRSNSKINAAIGNAKVYLDIMETEPNGFSGFLWDFVDGAPIVNKVMNYRDHMVKSPESEAMAKELKRRGFKFCGPVIVYAFMQAVGMVNDHETACPRWKAVQKFAR